MGQKFGHKHGTIFFVKCNAKLKFKMDAKLDAISIPKLDANLDAILVQKLDENLDKN